MTLIVGYLCSDGVVIGADSLATLGSGGSMTVQEPTSKLSLIKKQRILALTGPVGLHQRYRDEMEKISWTSLKQKKPSEIGVAISEAFWRHANIEYERSRTVVQATQNPSSLTHAMHSSLVALQHLSKDRLYQFSETCAPEEATDELPYVALGSGQANADPFLAFLKRVLWDDRQPTIADGQLAVYWALHQTIEATPLLGGDPVLATLQRGKAEFVPEEQLLEHRQAIDNIESQLRYWRDTLSAETSPDTPPPPEPPAG